MRLDGSLVWPKPIAQVSSLEKFYDYRSIHENHENFHLERFVIYGIFMINTTSHSLRNTSLDSEKKWTGNERKETFFNWKEIK